MNRQLGILLSFGAILFTTSVLTFDDIGGVRNQGEEEEHSLEGPGGAAGGGGGFHSRLPPGILPHGLPQVKEVQPAVTQMEKELKKEEEKKEGMS